LDVALHPVLFVCVSAGKSRILPHIKTSLNFLCFCQWRNDGVAAASSDGAGTGGRGPPTVLEFLVINFSVCLVLLSRLIVTY